MSDASGADRVVRWTTTVSVVVLVRIAAITSYTHMLAVGRKRVTGAGDPVRPDRTSGVAVGAGEPDTDRRSALGQGDHQAVRTSRTLRSRG
jgi:hypothetical protein